MRDPVGRRRAALTAATAGTLIGALIVPTSALAQDPPGIDRFMPAIGTVESNGRYDARNPESGAYGKYQIMPTNWPRWAETYVGDDDARPTARNQERVARGKFIDLFRWLRTWPIVAHWWLTGSRDRDSSNWSPYSTRYVNQVLRLYGAAEPRRDTATLQESTRALVFTGRWRDAPFARHSGGHARYSNQAGASATFTFIGSRVAWVGPQGPTRGRARVYVDGRPVRTVDLYRSSFRARRTLFSTRFEQAGPHTLTVEVVGTKGRPTVAVDAFVVDP